MNSKTEVVIVDAVRSAIGRRGGSLSTVSAPDLLGALLSAIAFRSGIDPAEIGHVIGGNVISVGAQSNNVARNAWLGAGLPPEVPAVTVTSQCGSSQEAITLSHAMIAGGLVDVVVACGVETMTTVPIGANTPRQPNYGEPRGGHFLDHYELTTQFEAAERIAEDWSIAREDLDEFAKRSQDRSLLAQREGRFTAQIVGVETPSLGNSDAATDAWVFDRDECLRETSLDGLAALRTNPRQAQRPSLHTAGSSSQIADGAAAVLLTSAEAADRLGLEPRARVVSSVLVGCDPVMMLTGPIPATRTLVRQSGISLGAIDLFEINEAFASVVLAWRKELGVDLDRVNVNGGAIALGHPLGATGAILVAKIINELERSEGRYGLVSMCCGGGLGTGTILERL